MSINVSAKDGKVRITTPQGNKERAVHNEARQVLADKDFDSLTSDEVLKALKVLFVEKGYIDDAGKIVIPVEKASAISAEEPVNESKVKG
jgi:hypothetical protein